MYKILLSILLTSSLFATPILKTGQKFEDHPGSDGTYQQGKERKLSRESSIVTDHVTKLQWHDNEDAQFLLLGYDEAVEYCKNLNLGGHDDWRLASVEEFQTIMYYGLEERFVINPDKPRIMHKGRGGYPESLPIHNTFNYCYSGGYWTSTPYAYNPRSSVWFADFYNATVDHASYSNKARIRCVRALD